MGILKLITLIIFLINLIIPFITDINIGYKFAWSAGWICAIMMLLET